MLYLIGGGLGIGVGLWVARRKGGNRLDLLHHAAIYGIVGFLLGLVGMLVIPAPG
jgi:Na+-driven multidrug efflux pump